MPESDILTFPTKSTIFREGEETSEMYIIISGKVKIIKATGNGRNLVLANLGHIIYNFDLSPNLPPYANHINKPES